MLILQPWWEVAGPTHRASRTLTDSLHLHPFNKVRRVFVVESREPHHFPGWGAYLPTHPTPPPPSRGLHNAGSPFQTGFSPGHCSTTFPSNQGEASPAHLTSTGHPVLCGEILPGLCILGPDPAHTSRSSTHAIGAAGRDQHELVLLSTPGESRLPGKGRRVIFTRSRHTADTTVEPTSPHGSQIKGRELSTPQVGDLRQVQNSGGHQSSSPTTPVPDPLASLRSPSRDGITELIN